MAISYGISIGSEVIARIDACMVVEMLLIVLIGGC
jgi:hypothetical protein